MNRLVRIASLGRSLGMYLIACTQNPMGQVSADMKANMSVSICLRVRDRLQSCELLGDGRAADLSPAMPGAAFCNDSEQVTAFRCATARDIDAVCRQIAFASRFVGSPPQPSLFTAPLPRHVKDRTVATTHRNAFDLDLPTMASTCERRRYPSPVAISVSSARRARQNHVAENIGSTRQHG